MKLNETGFEISKHALEDSAESSMYARLVVSLAFVPLLDPLIERLHYPRIHRGNYVHRGVQFLLGHSRFPCVRKASVHSRIAEPHHRDGETDEHLLAIGQALDRMRITVKRSKICFCHFRAPFGSENLQSRVRRPETQNPRR